MAAAARLVWVAAAAAVLTLTAAGNKTSPAGDTAATEAAPTTSGSSSSSSSSSSGLLGLHMPALHRALYVIAGVAGIGLLYYLGGPSAADEEAAGKVWAPFQLGRPHGDGLPRERRRYPV